MSRFNSHLHEAFREQGRVEQGVCAARHLQGVRHVVDPESLGALSEFEDVAEQLLSPDLTQETVGLQVQQTAVEKLQRDTRKNIATTSIVPYKVQGFANLTSVMTWSLRMYCTSVCSSSQIASC